MKVIITFTFCCDNLWKSKFVALEKPGKLREFFYLPLVATWIKLLFEGYVGPWDSRVGWRPGSPFGITGAVTFLVSQSFLGSEKCMEFPGLGSSDFLS